MWRAAMTALLLLYAALVFAPIVAQEVVPFVSFPAIYAESAALVAKRGANLDGTPNGRIYIRNGWGGCVRTSMAEVRDFFRDDLDTDNFINLRDYAANRYRRAEPGEWDDIDRYNCPPQPLEVKPYYRGSRPVYYRVFDEEQQQWTRGGRSPYRVKTAGEELPGCQHYGTVNARGKPTDYWLLEDTAKVFRGDVMLQASEVDRPLVVVCRAKDIDVTAFSF